MYDNFIVDVPNIGEVLLEPFTYSNGRKGLMCTTEGDYSYNLTLNIEGIDTDLIILKMYHTANEVNNHLLKTTDMFEDLRGGKIGFNNYKIVKLNEKFYENEN